MDVSSCSGAVLRLLFGAELGEPRRLALAQKHERLLEQRQLRLRLLVAALGLLLDRRRALLAGVEIGEHQLGLDRLRVGNGIDAVLDMRDVVVLEAAQHVGDRVHLADVGEELVAEPFALRRAAHETGDVDEREPRRDDLRRLGDRGERVEPLVRHADLADVGLDGAERIVRGFGRRRLRQRIEEGRLADVRQADDAALEAHDLAVLGCRVWLHRHGPPINAQDAAADFVALSPGLAIKRQPQKIR